MRGAFFAPVCYLETTKVKKVSKNFVISKLFSIFARFLNKG